MEDLSGVGIHVNGIVQGVGFRPFIFGLAHKYELTGWVRNTSSGVDIELDGPKNKLESFIQSLDTEAPPLAYIDEVKIQWKLPNGYSHFQIEHSETVQDAFQPISPDVSICPDCLREMFDPSDRRYKYPFINCTNCGPRFTIIKDIPYDRPKTTMAPFEMCVDCAREYADPLDRRFHAQPIACPVCGPQVWLEFKMGSNGGVDPTNPIEKTQGLLKEGKIVAVKGLGGFHLACDATNQAAVIELRSRKLRVDKPFALMMANTETIEKYCDLNDEERKLLESPSRPIVLLRRKPGTDIALENAPGQDYLGVMLPYTPLHYLLFDTREFDALVMTSANLSEEPIVTTNETARDRLVDLADAFLMHDRDIHVRCDDSVVRVYKNNIFPIRRSRGYAPFPVYLSGTPPVILACGAELKNTFCITRGNYAFLSQHIGDMENLETLESFRHGITHFEKLFRIKIEAIAFDKHPDYLASRYALDRVEREAIPGIGVQHHHAHIASCMVENRLPSEKPVIGVAYDGTGYGEDGTIWGGEILLADLLSFDRIAHLKTIPLPGGDLAVRQPWRIALAWLDAAGVEWDEYLPAVKWIMAQPGLLKNFKTQLKTGLNSPKTSSMGRLFDAVSALAGVRHDVNYEAQAAIEFEALADTTEMGMYEFSIIGKEIDPSPLFHQLTEDIKIGLPLPNISAKFHNGVADMTAKICTIVRKERGIDQVTLSGGVWQNITLLRSTLEKLENNGFQVFIHKVVPSNDGGLAIGQAMIAAAQITSQ